MRIHLYSVKTWELNLLISIIIPGSLLRRVNDEIEGLLETFLFFHYYYFFSAGNLTFNMFKLKYHKVFQFYVKLNIY